MSSSRSLTSNKSSNSIKFRMLFKHRNHGKQLPKQNSSPNQHGVQHSQRSSRIKLKQKQTKCSAPSSIKAQQPSSINDLKTYVRNHIKTQYKDQPTNALTNNYQQRMNATAKSNRSFNLSSSHHSSKLSNQFKTLTYTEIDAQRLEKRIQNLIDLKLEKFTVKAALSGEKHESALSQQLERLLKQIISIKQSDNPEDYNQDLQLLTKRISLLQKMIAENDTQFEIIKKYYLSQVTNKPNKHQRISKSSFNFYNPSTPLKSLKTTISESRTITMVTESTKQRSFQRPHPQDYQIYQHQNTFFNADRHLQPYNRSTYSKDYLVWGPTPNNAHSHKPQSSNIFQHALQRPKSLKTSYQQAFDRKNAEKNNYKDLDCYRNKYKLLDINYSKKKNQQHKIQKKNSDHLQNGNVDGKILQKLNKTLQTTINYPKQFLKSQSKRQFENKMEQFYQKSTIKHHNLQKLKYLLKLKSKS